MARPMPNLCLAMALLASAVAAQSPFERIDEVFALWDNDDTPGVALGIIHKGELLYARGYGMANLEHAVPISSRTVFRIGSTSKQFTAMCIALLAREGKLDLDADVRTYLPELPKQAPAVTTRHLVHHTSGIPDYVGVLVTDGIELADHVAPAETLERIAQLDQLEFTPGDRHSYSNSNYFLLSQIVERVSGQTLREYAHENIFAPLGMEQTHFHDQYDEIVPLRADGHEPHVGHPSGWKISNTRWEQVGDGGVFTSVEDMARWDANFYDNRLGGGGPELIEMVLTPGRLNDDSELAYAFGLTRGDFMGHPAVSHGGGWVGFRAEMMRLPDQRLTVIALSNCAVVNPTAMCAEVARLLLP